MRHKIKIVLAALALLVGATQTRAAGPAFDAAVTTGGTASSFVVSHTTSGSDRFIVVDVGYDPNNPEPVTAVTYDGVSLTEQMVLENNAEQGLSRWCSTNPSIGDNPVTVMLDESVKCAIGVRSYTGVHQTLPIGDSASLSITGTAAAVTVTTVEDNSLVIGAAAWEGANTLTVGAGQTERYKVVALGGGPTTRTTLAGDDEAKAVAGGVVMSYTYSVSNPGVIDAFVLQPPSGVGSPTPTCTVTSSPTPGPKGGMYTNPYSTRYFVTSPGTEALLRMENNVYDEVGKISWTNYGSTPYSNTKFIENLYGVGEFDSGVDNTRRIESDAAIPVTVKTIEFWVYTDWDTIGANQFCYGVYALQVHLDQPTDSIDFVCYGGWSAKWALADDTYHHIALTSDQVDITLFHNNVEKGSVADNQVMINQPHVIGNYKSGFTANSCDCWMDYVRLSSVLRTNFPTSD